jgi:hypothetical protein
MYRVVLAERDMVDAVKEFVAQYLTGESTYPDTLASLDPLVGCRQAREILRRAVEEEGYVPQLEAV